MSIDPESTFQSEFAKIPPVPNQFQAAQNTAKTCDARVTNKAGLTGIIGSLVYTFQEALFATQLLSIVPVSSNIPAATAIANAWATAAATSIMVVPPGSSVGAPSPATTFSVVISTTLDPPSLAAAQAIIVQMLTAAVPVPNAQQNVMGPALYAAFKALTFSIVGLDSTPTPVGPLPLLAPLTPLA